MELAESAGVRSNRYRINRPLQKYIKGKIIRYVRGKIRVYVISNDFVDDTSVVAVGNGFVKFSQNEGEFTLI